MTTQIVKTNEKLSLQEASETQTRFRLAATTMLAGFASYLVGAILWGTAGADLDHAVTVGSMAEYMETAVTMRTTLLANLTLWIIGALLLGMACTTLGKQSRRWGWAQAVQSCYRPAVPIVVISYLAMLTLVTSIAVSDSATAVAVAEAVGWFGATADWVATILMLGIGPFLLSKSGEGDWAPTWLIRFSYLNLFCGLLTAVGVFAGGRTTYAFIVIPVGMIWLLVTGILLWRQSSAAK